jgi:hypothetical protein
MLWLCLRIILIVLLGSEKLKNTFLDFCLKQSFYQATEGEGGECGIWQRCFWDYAIMQYNQSTTLEIIFTAPILIW